MIFDTSFVIDLMRKEEHSVKKLKELASRGEPQIIATPTLFELYSGLMQTSKPDTEKQKILYVLSNLLVWHLDGDSAVKAGEIDGKLVKQGHKIEPVDSMIAGVTITKNEKLLTRNLKHFSKIPELKVETY